MMFKPTGMQQANDCPYCHMEAFVSLERQELSLNDDKTELTILNGFECNDCCEPWWQTIVVKLGEVVSNEVDLGQDDEFDAEAYGNKDISEDLGFKANNDIGNFFPTGYDALSRDDSEYDELDED